MSHPTTPGSSTRLRSGGTTPDAWTPDRPQTASKRSLIAVSHAIEQALLDGPLSEPTVVIALFQRMAYLEPEYDVYARLAEAGAVVVLAFADGEPHQVPPGCQGIVLDPNEPLADEWTVIAVGPSAGAFLVATDAHRFDPTEQTLEAGREFEGRWGYSRVQAGNELARMRAALGYRLDTAVSTTIDHLLARVMPTGGSAAQSRGTDGEVWATISLHRMVRRMQDARAGTRILRAQLVDAHSAVAARSAAHTDPQSGLTAPEFLSRWTNTSGPTALPVGVAVFDIAGLDEVGQRYDARSGWHAARRVAAALTEPLGPVDAAVRISEREFALVVPGASGRHLRHLVAAVGEQLELSSEGYPGIPLSATVASTVTLTRPLPLDDLHLALGTPGQAASTLGGDPITVTTTADATQGATEHASPGGPATDAFPSIRVDSVPTTSPELDGAGSNGDGSRDGSRDGTAYARVTSFGGLHAAGGNGRPVSRADQGGSSDGAAGATGEAEQVAAPGDPGAADELFAEQAQGPGDRASGEQIDGGEAAGEQASDEESQTVDRDVARRADRALNMLSGLPRRGGRRDGQHVRMQSPDRSTSPGFGAGPVAPPNGDLSARSSTNGTV